MIDLEGGNQPMLGSDGRVAIVFNGEIYNYRELRQELERAGEPPFRTQSDTEVLLRQYAHRGAACLGSLRGMFAFGLWDERRQRLLLARDRVGKKPLYYTQTGGVLYFASSLNSLIAGAGDTGAVELQAVDSLMTLGYIPAPLTIFANIRKLESGTALSFPPDEDPEIRFWDPAQAPPFQGGYAEALGALDEHLRTAVNLRLRSDVPLGVFLSGGLDSSLVTAMAVQQSRRPVRTFTIAFAEREYDESSHAAAVAAHLGTVHRAYHVQPNVLELLPRYVRHFGEPFADPSAFPLWMLAEHARSEVTVALGGDGGDEGFAGYNWYFSAARMRRLGRLIPPRAAHLGGRIAGVLAAGSPGRLRQMFERYRRGFDLLGAGDPGRQFALLRCALRAQDAEHLYAGELAEWRAQHGPLGSARLADFFASSGGSALRRMRYADVRTYLADGLMPKVDVATMAHGLEARAPLLDHELLGFALSLPDEFLVDDRGGKRLLRDLLARFVPPHLTERSKQGFTPPLKRWFAGALGDRMRSLARSDALRSTGWFRPDGVGRLVAEHQAAARDHTDRLFALLVLEEWIGTR